MLGLLANKSGRGRSAAALVAAAAIVAGVAVPLVGAGPAAAANGKATVTVTAFGTQTYGASSPTLGYTATSSDGSTNFTVTGTLSCSYPVTSSSDFGSYAITSCTGLTVGPSKDFNANPLYMLGSISVTKAPLTVTAPSPTKTYGQANPPLTPTITGFVNGQNASVFTTQPICTTTATTASGVGTHPVTCSGLAATNYTATYVAGSLTITKAPLTVTASSASIAYGDALPAVTASYSGFVNRDDPSAVSPAPTCSNTATGTSHIGGYATKCSGAGATNYALSYVDGTLTIGTRTIAVSAPNPTITYGDALPALAPSYTGFATGHGPGELATQATCTTTAQADSKAGSYAVTCAGAAGSDYTFSYTGGTLTIAKKTLTITGPTTSMTYGGSVPALTPSYSGFTAGQSSADLTTPATCTTAATAASDAGSYDVTCSGADSPNYSFSYVKGSLTVTAAPLQLTTSGSQTYGGTPHYTWGGVLPSAVTVAGDLSCATAGLSPSTAVGDYPIDSCAGLSLTGAKAADFDLTLHNGTLHVSPAPLTVTAPIVSKRYGATVPALQPTIVGAANEETIPVSCTTTADQHSAVGTYPIICTVSASSNYEFTGPVSGLLTVDPAPLTVSATGSKVYGAAVPDLTPVYTGLVNGDTTLAGPGTCSTDATMTSSAGQYTVTCQDAHDPNYAISYPPGTFTVTPALLTITAPSPSKVYGAEVPNLAPSYSGLTNGDAAPAQAPTCTSGVTSTSAVGDYRVTCDGANDDNYAISYVPGTLTVTPASLTVLAPSVTETYGFTAMPSLVPTFVGLVNDDDPPATNCTTKAGPSGHVGTYPITCTTPDHPNYELTPIGGTFTIEKKALTVTANDAGMVYGDAPPALTPRFDGFQYDDNADSLQGSVVCGTDANLVVGTHTIACGGATSEDYDVQYVDGVLSVARRQVVGQVSSDTMVYGSRVPALHVSYDLVAGDDADALGLPLTGCTDLGAKPAVGEHTVTCAATSTHNYDVTYAAGTLTVTQAALVVKADDQSMVYGGRVPALTSTIVGGTPDETVTGTISCKTDDGPLHAGTHPITCEGLSSDNFDIAFQRGELTVGKAPLTGSVSSARITYGKASPALALTYGGFQNGETAASLGLPSSCAGPDGIPTVGTYTVSCGDVDLHDYSVTITAGKLTVDKAPLTVQTDSHAIPYGTAAPDFGVSYDGFVNSEDKHALAGSLHCNAPTGIVPAGTYPVLCDGLTSDNYAITFKPGELNVTKADLLVAAKNDTMTYGQPVPTLTADITGTALEGGDASITGTLKCSIDTAKPGAGPHRIKCEGLSSPNYTITYQDATLTVLPARLTITPQSHTITYGDNVPTFAVEYSGFVPGDGIGSLTGSLDCIHPTGVVHVGHHPLTCTGLSNPNYAITWAVGYLDVTPAALTGQTGSGTMTYGGSVPAIGVTYSGWQNSDDEHVLTGTLSCDTPNAPHVGTYTVMCGGQTAADYTVTYAPGSLTVRQATLTGVVPNRTAVYGAALPTFPVDYQGLVGADTAEGIGLPLTCQPPTAPKVGSYTISCDNTETRDYVVTYRSGTLDVTPATLTVTAPNASRLAGQQNPTFAPLYSGWAYGDGTAALTTQATCTTTAVVSSPPGSYPITCSGATAHDYVFTYVAGTLTVKPNWRIVAFAQPINDPAGSAQSVVKGGSTVPVKFQLTDEHGALLPDATAAAIATACNAKVTYSYASGTVGTLNDTATTDSPSSGACFRYDSTAHQFIYNLSTKSMQTGTWTVGATVTMADGSLISHTVTIGLR